MEKRKGAGAPAKLEDDFEFCGTPLNAQLGCEIDNNPLVTGLKGEINTMATGSGLNVVGRSDETGDLANQLDTGRRFKDATDVGSSGEADTQHKNGPLDEFENTVSLASQQESVNVSPQHEAARKYAAAGLPIVALKKKSAKGEFELAFDLSGSTDLAVIDDWWQQIPEAIPALSGKGIGRLSNSRYQNKAEHLDMLEACFGPMPDTLYHAHEYVLPIGKSKISHQVHHWYFTVSQPVENKYFCGMTFDTKQGWYVLPLDFDLVPKPIAPMPDWFTAAARGDHYHVPLDTPEAITRGREMWQDQKSRLETTIERTPAEQHETRLRLIREFEKEETYDHGKKYTWGEEEDNDYDNQNEIRYKNTNGDRPYHNTTMLAMLLLYEDITVDRVISLMDVFWNVRNKPPIPRAKLAELVWQEWEEQLRDGADSNLLEWRAVRGPERPASWGPPEGGDGSDLATWLSLPEPEKGSGLLGSVIAKGTRSIVFADTGIGKTMLLATLAVHMAAGKDFLHWRIPRPVKVLYIDGLKGSPNRIFVGPRVQIIQDHIDPRSYQSEHVRTFALKD